MVKQALIEAVQKEYIILRREYMAQRSRELAEYHKYDDVEFVLTDEDVSRKGKLGRLTWRSYRE